MIALAPHHPARLAVGAAKIAVARAKDATHATICGDVVGFAAASRDLTAEIATDASYLMERFEAALADNRIDDEERAELRGLVAEIQTEAVTGRILSTAS